jgi:hypothetical protein
MTIPVPATAIILGMVIRRIWAIYTEKEVSDEDVVNCYTSPFHQT